MANTSLQRLQVYMLSLFSLITSIFIGEDYDNKEMLIKLSFIYINCTIQFKFMLWMLQIYYQKYDLKEEMYFLMTKETPEIKSHNRII